MFENIFLFHCCNVLFYYHFFLRSKARLSKIIPAFQVPRNLVYERDPSAAWMVPSTDVLGCAAVCTTVFSLTGCVWKHRKWLFLFLTRQQLSAVAVLLCKQFSNCKKNKKNNLWLRGKLLLQLCNVDVVPLRALCCHLHTVSDLQCSVLWPYKKSADWPACSI